MKRLFTSMLLLIVGVHAMTKGEAQELSFDPMRSGVMLLQGNIDGYTPEAGFDTGRIFIDNIILSDNTPRLLTIKADGSFSELLHLEHAQSSFLSINGDNYCFYAIPDDTLTLQMSMSGFEERKAERSRRNYFHVPSDWRVEGRSARLHDELAKIDVKSNLYLINERSRELATASLAEYGAAMRSDYTRDSLELEQKLASAEYMDITKRVARMTLLTFFYDGLMMRSLMQQDNIEGYYITEDVECSIERKYADMTKHPDNYFFPLNYYDIDDTQAIVLSDFDTFINRYEYSAWFKHQYQYSCDPLAAIERFVRAGILNFNEVDRDILYSREKYPEDSLKAVRLNAMVAEHNADIYTFYRDSINIVPARLEWQAMSSAALGVWGKGDDILTQLSISRDWCIKLMMLDRHVTNIKRNDKDKIIRDLTRTVKEFVSHPHLLANIDRRSQEFLGEGSVAQSHPIPDGAGRAEFEALISPHKGSYILVDFWSTSCSPCVWGINNSHDVRERLKDEPVVFLFITSEATNINAYNKIMEPTRGVSHRISLDDWNRITSLFSINSIPRYMLLDPEGRILDDRFSGWSSIETRLKQVETLHATSH